MRVPAEDRIPLQWHNCRAYNKGTVYTDVGKCRKPIRTGEALRPWQHWDVQRVLALWRRPLRRSCYPRGRQPLADPQHKAGRSREDIPLPLSPPASHHPHGSLSARSLGDRSVETSLLRQERVERNRHEGGVDKQRLTNTSNRYKVYIMKQCVFVIIPTLWYPEWSPI